MPGMRCIVAACNHSLQKSKAKGLDISFFSFPKDAALRKKWVQRCRRKGKWKPENSHVCSVHFTQDDFKRDLRNELLGLRQRKKLKPGSLPTLFLTPNAAAPVVSDREKRKEVKERKRLIEEILNPKVDVPECEILENLIVPKCEVHESTSLPECQVQINQVTGELDTLKNDLQVLMSEKLELEEDNQSLRNIICNNQNKRKEHESIIRSLKKEITVLKRANSKPRPGYVERNPLLSCFSTNQLDIILKGKKKVCWTEEELAKAHAIRSFGKRCYLYLKNRCNYPLPGISTLQKWASRTDEHTVRNPDTMIKNVIVDDVIPFECVSLPTLIKTEIISTRAEETSHDISTSPVSLPDTDLFLNFKEINVDEFGEHTGNEHDYCQSSFQGAIIEPTPQCLVKKSVKNHKNNIRREKKIGKKVPNKTKPKKSEFESQCNESILRQRLLKHNI